MNEFGSFGANVSPEAMSAIKEALLRRQGGEGVPALNQQSGASPTQAPLPPEPSGGVPVPQPAPTQSEVPTEAPTGNKEAELIIKALVERLKTISESNSQV